MLKPIILILFLAAAGGGCKMAEAVSGTEAIAEQGAAVEKRIAEHARQNFSLAPSDISVKELKLDDLPSGVRQFYVEKKGASHGFNYNYFLWEDRLYSSGVDEDFGRFLKDYRFLEKKELDGKWFQSVLWKLNNFRDILLIDEERINNPREALKPFLGKIAPPQFSKNENGAVYRFYTQSVNVRPVQKFEVTVAPDYKVTFNREFVTP